MMQKTGPLVPFTDPQLCTTGNDWYIWFRFYHDGKWSNPIKLREGINRIKKRKEKLKFGEALAEARHDWLKLGWNPILDPEFKLSKIQSAKPKADMNFKEALLFALSKKKVKPKSLSGYTSQVNFIVEAAEETGHALLQISQVDRGACAGIFWIR